MSPGFEPGAEILSRYRLQEALGEGEWAVVYRAESLKSGQAVAIKFLRVRPPTFDPSALEPLAPLTGLEQENLVTLLDRTTEGPPGLVYEFIQGASLERLLEKHTRLAPAAALRIAEGLAKGLRFLHQAGLCYGPVTARNVLVDRKGKAKLADLGWCHLGHQANPAARPAPRAVDQCQAEEVQGLGALFFRSLVGTAPGPECPSMLGMLADLPPALDDVVQRALRGQFPSVDHFLQALGGLIRDRDIGSRKTPFDPHRLGHLWLEHAAPKRSWMETRLHPWNLPFRGGGIFRPRWDFWRLPWWSSLLDLAPLASALEKHLPEDAVRHSPTGLRILAWNRDQEELETFTNDWFLHQHVLASCSIPHLLPPVILGDARLCDPMGLAPCSPLSPLALGGEEVDEIYFPMPRIHVRRGRFGWIRTIARFLLDAHRAELERDLLILRGLPERRIPRLVPLEFEITLPATSGIDYSRPQLRWLLDLGYDSTTALLPRLPVSHPIPPQAETTEEGTSGEGA